MSEHRYTVLFEPAEEGGYVVTCPALPGLVTEGDTYEEAHERVVDSNHALQAADIIVQESLRIGIVGH